MRSSSSVRLSSEGSQPQSFERESDELSSFKMPRLSIARLPPPSSISCHARERVPVRLCLVQFSFIPQACEESNRLNSTIKKKPQLVVLYDPRDNLLFRCYCFGLNLHFWPLPREDTSSGSCSTQSKRSRVAHHARLHTMFACQ